MPEKIREVDFQQVCRLAKLVERTGKIPTYVIKDGSEGIELLNGKIRYFQVANAGTPEAHKVFDVVVNDKHIASVVGAFESKTENKDIAPHDPEPKKEEKKDEIHKNAPEKKDENKDIAPLDSPTNSAVELPADLTIELMFKWAKMTTTERILMFQKTPKHEIFEVSVGKNPETGKAEMASYVRGNFMIKEANAAFLFDWNLEVFEISTSETGVSVRGKINGWFSEYGKYLSRPATGYQERNKKIDAQQAQKGATTDAIKKGLSLFGFNSDVYSGEV